MTPAFLQLPDTWTLWAAADTGTYCSFACGAVSPDRDHLILDEVPNYRYVGGELELTGISMGEWAATCVATFRKYRADQTCFAWADPNTQFRAEFARYGLHLLSNDRGLELRTEIAREYLQQRKVWLAPWLQVLPYELENARWPNDFGSTGTFRRLKENDHTLDCFEHGLSRHPRSKAQIAQASTSFLDAHLAKYRKPSAGDAHLGRL